MLSRLQNSAASYQLAESGFAQEAFPHAGFAGDFRQHRLQRHGAAQARVLGLEDDAHAAATEHLEDAIPAQPAQLADGLRRGQEGNHVGFLVAAGGGRHGLDGPVRAARSRRREGPGPIARHRNREGGEQPAQASLQSFNDLLLGPVERGGTAAHRREERGVHLQALHGGGAAFAFFQVPGQRFDQFGRQLAALQAVVGLNVRAGGVAVQGLPL